MARFWWSVRQDRQKHEHCRSQAGGAHVAPAAIKTVPSTVPYVRKDDIATSRRELTGHTGDVARAKFGPGGRWLVTSALEDTLRLWDLEPADRTVEPIVIDSPGSGANGVAISPDARWLAVAAWGDSENDDIISLWDFQKLTRREEPPQNALVREMPGHRWTNDCEFTPDSRYLVAAKASGQVVFVDMQPGSDFREREVTAFTEGPILGLQISPDSSCAALRTWSDNRVSVLAVVESAEQQSARHLIGHGAFPEAAKIAANVPKMVT